MQRERIKTLFVYPLTAHGIRGRADIRPIVVRQERVGAPWPTRAGS
jgi:hypothetical protein